MPQELKKILDNRQEEYGNALENFETIGKIWGALLNIDPVEPYQVALMMDALKTVRLFKNPNHEDSWLDKEGYIQHGKDIVTQ
jgi:hypothetical protein